MNEARTVVFYHAQCTDGFGAAWAAHKALGESAIYLPVSHGEPPPAVARDAKLYLLDFAYRRATMEALRDETASLLVLDHHKSARDDLAGFAGAHFDMSKSGAMLAWEYFHPDTPAPLLIQYIQDRDLWRRALPENAEFSAALFSYPMDFAVWDQLDPAALFAEGKHILRAQSRLVLDLCGHARFTDLEGFEVPAVNTPVYHSEVGDELLRLYPQSPFVATYYETRSGARKWSLRSRGDFDVSALAARFGGGGHANAAGFLERY